MFSYRAMRMNMTGMMDGKNSLSSEEVLQDYDMAATSMTMDMHMFGAMYASSDQLTWMAMLPYLENDMDMLMKMPMSDGGMDGGMGMNMTDEPMKMNMKTSGLGDLKLGALYSILDQGGHKLHLNLSISLPTGSIDETNENGKIVAYPMQLGSGTYDLLPGITYTAQNSYLSWGAQAMATIRTSENDRDYTLGNRYKLQGWVQKPVIENLSLSLRVAYEDWDNIDGEDADIMMTKKMNPLADPNNQGGNLLSAGLGANLTLPAGHRLALEYTTELQQKLDGPQMAFDNSLVLAWQWAL